MNLQINIKCDTDISPKEILQFQDSFTKLANAIFELGYGEMELLIRERRPSITKYPMKSLRLD
jgi:hypothetical protein